MRKSRYSEEKIIRVLEQVEGGQKVKDVIREHGISEQTYYRWKSKYGGMSVSDAKRLKQLEASYPDNKDVELLRAKRASINNDFSAAIVTLKELMQNAPLPEVVIDLAKNQWSSANREAAISGLELWTEENSDSPDAMMLLANYYLSENRTAESAKTFEKLEKQLPDNPIVLNNLAWTLIDSDPKKGIIGPNMAPLLS